MRLSLPVTWLTLSSTVLSQAFVPAPQGLTEVLSEKFPGASITYKEVNGICETSDGVKSYSGYIHLPKAFLPDAASWPDDVEGHIFFWYFEARNDPNSAPTAIYMGGGPGYTTFDGSAVFPCYFNDDSNSTTVNEHSWNKDTNMLYIDQPLGSGFSYTTLTNGTYNLANKTFTELEDGDDLPELSLTLRQATINSHLNDTLTNTTMSCARTLWRFAQVFFNDFPEWETEDDKIAVWSVSYGGLFAPLFAAYTVEQNSLIDEGSHNLTNATTLNVSNVGVMNAVVDARAMVRGVPDFLRNNTYGLDLLPDNDMLDEVLESVPGCYDAIDDCRAAVAEGDPEGFGGNSEVNQKCVAATKACMGFIFRFGQEASTWRYDITQNNFTRKPSEYNTAFFNQAWVQAELGVPLNFTRSSYRDLIQNVFLMGELDDNENVVMPGTGDAARYDTSYLSKLIDSGVNVAMVYGDLDFQCNWLSGENASLQIDYANKSSFASAGYASLMTNATHEGGLVREAGLLSFSRVYQAGHSAGGYQPETLSAIFNRALFGYDVATGEIEISKNQSYSTEGAMSIRDVKKDIPGPDENVCYVFLPGETCTNEQFEALMNGTAETKDWVVVDPKGIKGVDMDGAGGNGSGSDEEEGDDGNDGDNGGTVDEEDSAAKFAGTWTWALAMGAIAIVAF